MDYLDAFNPSYADLEAADQRLQGHAVVTPLLESPLLNDQLGGRLLVKAECLQRTGSFKFRGAFNAISKHMDQGGGPVVAFSSGNHAQAVAEAARLHNIQASIVMPADAPAPKIANTRALGGEVILYDRYTEDRAAIAGQIATERGATIIPPFDHPDIIAGQGTLGMEIARQCNERHIEPDFLLVPCSGGGLSAGCAIAADYAMAGTQVRTVEPENFDDFARSLTAGKRQDNSGDQRSCCDALLVPQPGALTFPILQALYDVGVVGAGLRVSDAAALQAVAVAFRAFKIVVEPGGAVALAAVLSGALDITGATVVVVCSGGNIAADLFIQAITENPAIT
ncbi:MAG: threonine ammonia-lyase [Magnetospiraceae bacterium]